MPIAVAFDDVKGKIRRTEADDDMLGGAVSTVFVGRRQALLNQFDLGKVSLSHFHFLDQFQIVIGGKGNIGRNELAPYSLHFARAGTPYGPLAADASNGLVFFNLRTADDPGSQRLPKKKDVLKEIPDRQPFQITRRLSFPNLDEGSQGYALQAVPGVKADDGLAAYTLSMKPKAQTLGPDPAQGKGQYLVIVKGGIVRDNKEYKAPALVYVEHTDGPLAIVAGNDGLEAIIVNFPAPRPQVKHDEQLPSMRSQFKTWQCTLCSFQYNEALGIPDEGIAPGTRWEDIPESWVCPDCAASKSDFQN